jgi:hypothetical protein
MRMQLAPLLTLAAVVAFAAAALAIAGTSEGRNMQAGSQTIAEASARDFRTVLTATKTSGGAAPTAAVTATSFERRDGRWARTGTRELPGTYFWKTVTGPRAVCRLEIRTSGAGAAFRPRARAQLLVSPSLGCGRASTYAPVE